MTELEILVSRWVVASIMLVFTLIIVVVPLFRDWRRGCALRSHIRRKLVEARDRHPAARSRDADRSSHKDVA